MAKITTMLSSTSGAIFTAIISFIGLGFFVAALLFYPVTMPVFNHATQTNIIPYENIDLLDNGTEADARVTNITEESNCLLGAIKGNISSSYYYVCDYGQIEFDVDGKTYNAVLRTNSDPKPNLNDTIKILYAPADPAKVLVKDEKFISDYLNRKITNSQRIILLLFILTLLMGIGFLICGIFMFIKGLKSAPLSAGGNPTP